MLCFESPCKHTKAHRHAGHTYTHLAHTSHTPHIHLTHRHAHTSHTPHTQTRTHLTYTSHTDTHTPHTHLTHRHAHTSHTPHTQTRTHLTHTSHTDTHTYYCTVHTQIIMLCFESPCPDTKAHRHAGHTYTHLTHRHAHIFTCWSPKSCLSEQHLHFAAQLKADVWLLKVWSLKV